jgi:membrane protease YdiL (CAAX protease family)
VRALGVFVFGYFTFLAGGYLAWAISPRMGSAYAGVQFSGAPAWPVILLVAVLNPIYEEALWLGYAVTGPGRRRIGPAILLSVGVRVVVHAYQGPAALFAIAPLGLWYFRYYWRTQRLWPIILAHGLQDLVSLAWLASHTAG